jgi:hypothetical protein
VERSGVGRPTSYSTSRLNISNYKSNDVRNKSCMLSADRTSAVIVRIAVVSGLLCVRCRRNISECLSVDSLI